MGDWSSDVCPSDLAQRLGGYGNYVEVEHGNAIQTRYGHMSSYIVRSGQQVKKGDILGYVGSTGRSTGNHLHYEVRIEGAPVNPLPFVRSDRWRSPRSPARMSRWAVPNNSFTGSERKGRQAGYRRGALFI